MVHGLKVVASYNGLEGCKLEVMYPRENNLITIEHEIYLRHLKKKSNTLNLSMTNIYFANENYRTIYFSNDKLKFLMQYLILENKKLY